jgi:hydrogenase nickel incorporation protein HypA/HybF
MHELSLSQAIVETATRHAGACRVVLISVTIGALRQVVPGSLTFCFEIVARGTVCEGAVLEARLLAARMRCACGEEWELQEPSFRCPACGGGQTSILDGDQLSVDSIEVEEEIACTAPR